MEFEEWKFSEWYLPFPKFGEWQWVYDFGALPNCTFWRSVNGNFSEINLWPKKNTFFHNVLHMKFHFKLLLAKQCPCYNEASCWKICDEWKLCPRERLLKSLFEALIVESASHWTKLQLLSWKDIVSEIFVHWFFAIHPLLLTFKRKLKQRVDWIEKSINLENFCTPANTIEMWLRRTLSPELNKLLQKINLPRISGKVVLSYFWLRS